MRKASSFDPFVVLDKHPRLTTAFLALASLGSTAILGALIFFPPR